MATAAVNNGVNVQALLDAREALKDAPGATAFMWRASCKWQNGTYSKTNVKGFFGLGQEQSHKTETSFEADHPEVFAAEDRGITPIEYVLVGLASCLTAGIASVAQYRGIQLKSVKATIEGWKSFMENPAPALEEIKKANPNMTDGQIAYGMQKLRDLKVVSGGDAAKMGIGIMTDERWKKTADFMVASGLLKPTTDYKKAYTTQFVKDLKIMP